MQYCAVLSVNQTTLQPRVVARQTALLCSVMAMALLAAGCSTQGVRRAALVPHLQPTARTGQPMGPARAAISLASVSTLGLGKPEEVDGANAGVEIPRWHASAAARIRVTRDFDLGLLYDHGFELGARKLDSTQPDSDNGDVSGAGFGAHYSIPTSIEGFRIGIASNLLIYSVPYIEYRTCIDGCAGNPFLDISRHRDNIAVLSQSVIPSWKIDDRWTIYASITARNHPTVDKKSIESVVAPNDEPIEAGPFNIIVNAGADIDLGHGIRAAAHVYQPVYAEPVKYGPTIGLSLTLPLFREPARPQPAPSYSPYAPYPAASSQ